MNRKPRLSDRLIWWGYWVVLVLLAIGTARTLYKLALRFGYLQ